MNRKKIAKELQDLGNSDFRLLSRIEAAHKALERNRARRCELLQEVACHADTGLDGETVAAASAPKDGGSN